MSGGIRDKLAVLRERRVETFGSTAHGFELSPPLGEQEIAAVEARHGIVLPESYRTFLATVGASGAGPYYGLAPASRWGDALLGDVAMPDFAARECVWTPGSTLSWEEAQERLAEPFQGAIVIADQGCAYYAMLVVTGEARGRVMYVNMDGYTPYFVEDLDFRAWYERWLDELLMGFRHSWFGRHIPGTPASFTATARDAKDPRRLQALHAMGQLPELAADAQEVVALRVRDVDPKVRAVALWLVKHFGLGAPVEVHLRSALSDADPTVREPGLDALISCGLSWESDARALLSDPVDAVATSALRALEKAKLATETDVLPLLAREGTESTAQYTARTIPSPAIFDRVLEQRRASGDDRWLARLQTLAAQVRLGAVDGPRRAALLALAKETIAGAPGPEPPTAAIAALRFLALPAAEDAGRAAAFEALVALTRHPTPFFRFEAAHQLGELGDRAALPALRALADDPALPQAPGRSTAWSVGANAQRAIQKLGG